MYRSFPTRPQSAGGSTQKSFLLGGHRNRSNSACRPVIQRGENFAIVMPTKNENEVDDVLNLEESIDGGRCLFVCYSVVYLFVYSCVNKSYYECRPQRS